MAFEFRVKVERQKQTIWLPEVSGKIITGLLSFSFPNWLYQ